MEFLLEFFWLERLFEYLIKSTVVLTLALLLAYLFRKQSASLRHLVYSVSLIGTLVFPLLSTVQTGWKTRLLPTWSTEAHSAAPSTLSVIRQSADPMTLITNTLRESQNYGSQTAMSSIQFGIKDTRLWNVMQYSLLAIWLSGLALILVRQIFGLFGAYRLTREAEELTNPFWHQLLNRFLETVSMKNKIDLLQHKKVKVPLTWGCVKPVVIMPDDTKSWTAEQRESALYHELSHVKRRDFLVMMLARMSLGLYWFNPLIWVIFQLMKKEQEKACDELVLRTGIKASTYAANLLSIRRSIQRPWNPPTAVVGAIGTSQLNDRLLAILKQKFRFKEVKMRTKISLSVMVLLAVTFLGMARPSSPTHNVAISSEGNVFFPEDVSPGINVQEEQTKKKEQEKTDAEKDKEKKKDVFVWHLAEGEVGEVDVVITDKDKVKTFTLKKPVIIIKKDDSGKEIALTSKGRTIEIKKDKDGLWVVKEDDLAFHENVEKLDLSEGSVITLKTRTKDGHKVIEIKGPAVIVKEIDDSSKHITIEVNDEGGKKEAVVVSPRIHATRPDVDVKLKETELKKIHEKLQNIHERLSKKMESKTEEEEQALKDMEETLKKMEEKIKAMENNLKEINLSIHEEPHRLRLKQGHAISIKHKTDIEEGEEDLIYITKDKVQLMAFVNEEGEVTFLAHMNLENSQKLAFIEAIEELEQDIPEGYDIESEFDDESGKATIKIKGSAKDQDTKDMVMNLLKELKKKLDTNN